MSYMINPTTGELDYYETGSTQSDFSNFGDGSDGDLTLTNDAVMTRAMDYNTLDLNGYNIYPSGYVLRARTLYFHGGKIFGSGGNGGTGTDSIGSGSGDYGHAATALTSGSFGTEPSTYTGGQGVGGKTTASAGAAGVAGLTSTSITNSLITIAPPSLVPTDVNLYGKGGDSLAYVGGASGAKGAFGSIPQVTAAMKDMANSYAAISLRSLFPTGGVVIFSGWPASPVTPSGGSGATNNPYDGYSGAGGSSGAPGGNGRKMVVAIYQAMDTGVIESKGGDGGNGVKGGDAQDGSNAGGGGGGHGGCGGCGGIISLIIHFGLENITCDVSGGHGGTHGTGGLGKGSGGNGKDGQDGFDGAAGLTYILES